MHFFLYEIVARVVAIYLLFDSIQELRNGLIERRIRYFTGGDLIGSLLIDWSKMPVHRDDAPVRYWLEIGIRVNIVIACTVVAIFGWWQASS